MTQPESTKTDIKGKSLFNYLCITDKKADKDLIHNN